MVKRSDEEKLKRFIADRLGIPPQLLQGEKWDEELLRKKVVSEDRLLSLLSEFFAVPPIDLRRVKIPPELTKLIPKSLAESSLILPVEKSGPKLSLAMADPSDIQTKEKIRFSTGFNVQPLVALPFRIREKIEELYGEFDEEFLTKIRTEIMSKREEIDEAPSQILTLDDLRNLASQAPIVKLVNALIIEALKKGASDIHVEPFEDELRIRYRVDGVLREVARYRPDIKDAVVARIKVLSGLDIAEKRLPQDGRMRAKYQGRNVDFRVSTVPTIHGEKVVLRILDRGAVSLKLEELGLEEREYELLRRAISSPYGMVLVTGPTGSGKTTTLYSCISRINSPEINIMTVEDPVEYNIHGVNQVQVNPEIGLTFSRVLRAFLRQDPDVLMVGEIRDIETAEIAVEAALTGHLVLSTLHTNDAPSTITRLVEMGIEPFLVASSVITVVAQRLARKICPYCKRLYEYPEEVLREVGFTKEEIKKLTTYKGEGCERCDFTGYRGRVALFEVMEVSPQIREAIVKGKDSGEIARIAKEEGMRTLREIGKLKIAKGITTPEEILRITRSAQLR